MRKAIARRSPALLVLLFSACGGGAGTPRADGGSQEGPAATGEDAEAAGESGTTAHDNSAPLVVDLGPVGAMNDEDVLFVSVTLCVPGTTNCQTIDHVSVDTGSSGMRILASELSSELTLPQKTAASGGSLAECFEFDDGYTWGAVRLADVRVAGEVAANIPIQVIADPAFPSIPADCKNTGQGEDTVAAFGAKGLIGINQLIADCGRFCASAQANPPVYYTCSGASCDGVTLAEADQVSNPIASFPQDNNGAVLQLQSVGASGAPSASGTLVFGIGTAANNALGGATVLTLDESGNFHTVYKGQTFSESFIDSGSSVLGFSDLSIAQCPSNLMGFYCPASPLALTAQNIGLNNAMSTVSFSVESAETLFASHGNAAFDDIAGPLTSPGSPEDSFDWGLPFFFGRPVFVALERAQTPGGAGPYVAY